MRGDRRKRCIERQAAASCRAAVLAFTAPDYWPRAVLPAGEPAQARANRRRVIPIRFASHSSGVAPYRVSPAARVEQDHSCLTDWHPAPDPAELYVHFPNVHLRPGAATIDLTDLDNSVTGPACTYSFGTVGGSSGSGPIMVPARSGSKPRGHFVLDE